IMSEKSWTVWNGNRFDNFKTRFLYFATINIQVVYFKAKMASFFGIRQVRIWGEVQFHLAIPGYKPDDAIGNQGFWNCLLLEAKHSSIECAYLVLGTRWNCYRDVMQSWEPYA